MFLLVASLLGGVLALLYVLEVALLLKGVTVRPSTVLAAFAGHARSLLGRVVYVLGLVTDLARFIKEALLLLRDLFFRFVPREIILQAWRDLGAAFGALARVPLGAWDGFTRALGAVSMPWLTVILAVLATAVAPVVAELVAMSLGWDALRLTGFTHTAAAWLFAVGQEVGYALHYFVDLRDLAVRVVSFLFGWLPVKTLRQATNAVYDGLWAVVTAPVLGFGKGVSLLTNVPVGLLAGRLTVGVILVAIVWYVWPCCCCRRRPSEQPAAAADDAPGDDAPAAPPRRGRSRTVAE